MKTDGADLRDVVAAGGRPYVLCESSEFLAISDGEHKLVHLRRGNVRYVELFDLRHDPGEFRSVANQAEYGAAQARLARIIAELFVDALLS